ncbi:MAG: DUF4326 domain-containing protein [Azospirillum sp.]|nr:DUF4326 domain-containing protein [Azospirillum sp.]
MSMLRYGVRIHNIALDRDIPADSVYVGRNPRFGDPFWGNRHKIGREMRREQVIAAHRFDVENSEIMLSRIHELRGRDLVCHCAPADCHAETLARIANDPETVAQLLKRAIARRLESDTHPSGNSERAMTTESNRKRATPQDLEATLENFFAGRVSCRERNSGPCEDERKSTDLFIAGPTDLALSRTTLAIVGTAGRKEDADRLDARQWRLMLDTARAFVESLTTDAGAPDLVSGGAAWSDHLAVALFLENPKLRLALELPAAFSGRYDAGEFRFAETNAGRFDPGATANYYHRLFSAKIARDIRGFDSLRQIAEAIEKGAEKRVYRGFKERNLVVGKARVLLAFTFGGVSGTGPEGSRIDVFGTGVGAEAAGLKDGGTAHTWDRAESICKIHVFLPVADGLKAGIENKAGIEDAIARMRNILEKSPEKKQTPVSEAQFRMF